MPLVAPFRTSFGTEAVRDVLRGRVVTPGAEGWGECVAMTEPLYSAEYADGAADVIRRFLLPRLPSDVDAQSAARAMQPVRGHRMAKATLETAVLDAQLRASGESFGRSSGPPRDRVPCGVPGGTWASVRP